MPDFYKPKVPFYIYTTFCTKSQHPDSGISPLDKCVKTLQNGEKWGKVEDVKRPKGNLPV